MARKVFISVLGTGFYESCKYKTNDFSSSSTRFVQQATMEYYMSQNLFSNDSVAYILLTEDARKLNWDKNIKERKKYSGDIVEYKGLETILDGMNLPFPVKDVDIPNGGTEKEMWQIFSIVYNLIKDNEAEELYLDLTHSFRYLPMLMLVLSNYAKFLNRVKVRGITYGNYEARDHATNEAPIVNLLPLSVLQDWTFATADFLENSNTEKLSNLAKNELREIRRNQVDKRKDASVLGKYIDSLRDMVNERILCRGEEVINGGKASQVKYLYNWLKNEIITPLTPVLEKSLSAIDGLDNINNVNNQIKAAQWCLDHHFYQQAATFLEEGIITFFCHRHGFDKLNEEIRKVVPFAFSVRGGKKALETANFNDEVQLKFLNSIIKDNLLNNKEFVNITNEIVDLRNDYNHCGIKKQTLSIKKILFKLSKYVPFVVNYLCSEEATSEVQKGTREIFLNLSNHPSAEWSKEQLAAANEYGVIEDLEFPSVSPEASSDDIEKLAEEYADKVSEKTKEARVTVHLMGEMTFTFNLLQKLQARGVTCVASTTERVAKENGGMKTSEFKFIKFREY